MSRAFVDTSSQRLDNLTGSPVSAYPCTISAWFNVADNTQANILLAMYLIAGPGGTYVQLHAGGAATVIARVVTAASGDNATSTTTYSNDTWHHACGVLTSATDRAVFLDGGGKGTTSNSRTWPSVNGVSIAARYNNGGDTGGNIAEVAMWDAALDDVEVATLALGYSPLLVRRQSLVNYWPLIGNNSPEIDRVGGFDMTLVNAPTTAVHPRVIYPSLAQQIFAPAAAGASPLSINVSKSGDYIQVVTP